MKQGKHINAMRRQVGWFAAIGIGAILLLLLVITMRTDLFSKKFNVYVSPPSASAFFIGQDVKFQGFTIGRVRDIELQPQGRVRVNLHLLERYHAMLHEGATVRLIKQGFIGQQTVEITAGDLQAAIIRNKASVPYQPKASIEQLLLDLKPGVANADNLLNELVILAKWLNDPDGDVRQATANLRRASEGLDKGSVLRTMTMMSDAARGIQKLTRQLTDNKTPEHLASSLSQTARILKNLEPLTQALGKQGLVTLPRVNTLLSRLDKLTTSLAGISADLETLTPDLPGLEQESKNTIVEIHQMVKGLHKSWIFGGKRAPPVQNDGVAPPGLDFHP